MSLHKLVLNQKFAVAHDEDAVTQLDVEGVYLARLDLRCGACWALFRWDYFGSRMLEMIKEGDPDSISEAIRKDE